MNERNEACWCLSGKKWKKCHYPQKDPRKNTDDLFSSYKRQYGIIIKQGKQIEGIRIAGHLAAAILDKVASAAVEGVTTNYLDQLAFSLIRQAGATPASLHYGNPPFPKSICTSLNEVICHGIPDDIPLKDGDIVNIDLAVIKNGYFGDCSKMVAIGPVSYDKKLVFDTSYNCLMEAAKILRPGVFVCEIGDVICEIAHAAGCSVVKDFVGHGVGLKYHEPPQVPHCKNSMKIPLVEGMIFTIEPMINRGVFSGYIDEKDHWTVRTADGLPSAQWEHQFLITQDGYEILTPWTKTESVLES